MGLHGQGFRMYKFRTMRYDAEELLNSDPDLWDQYVNNDFKLPVSDDRAHSPRRHRRAGRALMVSR
jgi:lipopolysaccharide/colanic/teichoic acid biosynthesis glycosyltransferase